MTLIAENALLDESKHLLAARHLPEAVTCFQRAEAAGAPADRCAAGRWTAYMLSGQFEAAWQESDAIRRRGAHDRNRFWQGESLAGKRVISRCLHGFGDAVQFLRYVPRLRAASAKLIVEVPPRFLNLARCFDGVEEVITWGSQAPPQPERWDVQIEIMELPYVFRTQLSELPLATRYLHLPAPEVLQANHSSYFRVGIASLAGTWNLARAINRQLLQPILAVEGCEFWSLEGGPDHLQSTTPIFPNMHEGARCRHSIEGLAATISQLDLVITVDTLAAHLAGALGVKAWVLLQHEADWRWMHDRNDSPWYTSLTLFRQPVAGDWESVIAAVRCTLQTEVKSRVER